MFECDQNTPCARCVQKGTNARLFKQPCYRESLDNVVPFRLGMWYSLQFRRYILCV